MNLLNFNHSITSLFVLSFRVYQKNFISILFLTSTIMLPAFIIGILDWSKTESIIFFLSAHLLEGAITLGIIGIAFGHFFPSIGILRSFRSFFFIGSIHVALLQYLLFITGVMGLTLPFPFSIIVITFWLVGLLLTSMAQPIFVVENVRGVRALGKSIKLARSNLSRVFFVLVISTVLQFLLFAFIFSIFMPDLNLNLQQNNQVALPILFSEILSDTRVNQAIRWAQYLVSLLFYPFASLLCTFLYFDLSKQQNLLNISHLEQMSNKLFGTPIQEAKESEEIKEDNYLEPTDVKIVDPEGSIEDKEK